MGDKVAADFIYGQAISRLFGHTRCPHSYSSPFESQSHVGQQIWCWEARKVVMLMHCSGIR